MTEKILLLCLSNRSTSSVSFRLGTDWQNFLMITTSFCNQSNSIPLLIYYGKHSSTHSIQALQFRCFDQHNIRLRMLRLTYSPFGNPLTTRKPSAFMQVREYYDAIQVETSNRAEKEQVERLIGLHETRETNQCAESEIVLSKSLQKCLL